MTNLEQSENDHVASFADFITRSPSSYHASHEMARRLDQVGFKGLRESDPLPDVPGGYYFIRDGSLLAWILPEDVTEPSFRIVGCHTDSPGMKVKPAGSTTTPDGWGQIEVELYGGLLLNSWLDREIGFAGRVIDQQGQEHLVQTGPIARIPQLAPHLDTEVRREGLKLDRQKHMHPVWALRSTPYLFDLIAQLAGLDSTADIAGHDLFSYVTQAPERFGNEREFFAAGRQDNLSSVHAGLVALENLTSKYRSASSDVIILAAFDHEEVGSSTRSGAAGPVLDSLLRRICALQGGDEDGYHRALARSTCISADASHLVHPNYAEHHDPHSHPMPGQGPVLKLNANQHYASDAVGSAIWHRACEAAGIPHQSFVSNNASPCGTTIGPILSTRLGITTVDVGVGLLSMHSAREMSHVSDHLALSQALEAYWRNA